MRADKCPINRDDHVSQPQPTALGRASRFHRDNNQPHALPHLLFQAGRQTDRVGPNTQIPAADLPVRQQHAHHLAQREHRHRQRGSPQESRRVHPQGSTVCVHEHAAGESESRGHVGFNVPVQLSAHGGPPGLARGTDDAQPRPYSAARPGQGDHQLADLRRGIAPGRHAETRGLRPHYGQIGSWITTGQSGSDELTIGETDPDIVLLLNDVVSCYDRPVGGPDDSTSGEPPPGFDSNHRWPSLLDYSRDPAADFLQSLHHIHHLHST